MSKLANWTYPWRRPETSATEKLMNFDFDTPSFYVI